MYINISFLIWTIITTYIIYIGLVHYNVQGIFIGPIGIFIHE